MIHDALTAKLTAFASFAELVSACENGYVPTIPLSKNGRPQLDARKLVIALAAHGLRTWQPESGR